MVQRKLHADLHLCQASERGSSSWWIWGEEHKTWQMECWELGFFRASMRRGRGDFLPFFTTANRGWGVWCSVPWRTSMSWPSLIGCDALCIYNFCFAYEYVYPLAFDSIWVYLNSSFLLRVVEQEWHVVKLWNCMKQLLSSQFQDCCDHAHTHMNVQ